MHWAYYLTFALLAIYFAFLLYRHYKRKKEGRSLLLLLRVERTRKMTKSPVFGAFL